jgi:hypothetical protein
MMLMVVVWEIGVLRKVVVEQIDPLAVVVQTKTWVER